MRVKKARVSESAIRTFGKAVSVAGEFSLKINKGIDCIKSIMIQLSEEETQLHECIQRIIEALSELAIKIEEIKRKIHELEQQLDQYKDELQSLEDELDGTPKTIEDIDENGVPYKENNPEYERICDEIETLKSEIEEVEKQKSEQERRLEHAVAIQGHLKNQEQRAVQVTDELANKKNQCEQLQSELETLQDLNKKQSSAAYNSLVKILEVIEKYLHIRMRYESNLDEGMQSVFDTVNSSPNDTEKLKRETMTEKISAGEIDKHHIKFDKHGHISEYDGKTFGGGYNTYDVRLSRTLLSNTIFGRYEGDRGESKFIPSERTVSGIDVKSILNRYGIDGIIYRNAEPDFEVCAKAVVKIPAMTSNRSDFADKNGGTKLGNFSQADIELSKLWNKNKNEGRTNWTPRDILNYRHVNKLTWHEKCDTETMVLVESEINLYFKHSGGCSE